MNKMAYLRREKETVEIAHPPSKVWAAISKALDELEWTIEQTDEAKHHITAKTKNSLMSWNSTLLIDLTPADENTTKLSVAAETPVTTISSIIDFGRTSHRIDLFLSALAKQLNVKSDQPTKEQSSSP